MTNGRGGADLLRGLGLMADGPVLWGAAVRSRGPGLLVVERAAPAATPDIDLTLLRRWIEAVPTLRLDGAVPTPNELADRMASFWLAEQTVLYVGRSAKSLSGRAAALYATSLGSRRPHSGGHWLKALADLGRSRLWWAETDAPEEYEDALLAAFAEAAGAVPEGLAAPGTGALPWAVLESPTGARKPTGITGALIDEDTGIGKAAAAPPPARARKAAAPRATSPRTTASRSSAPPPGQLVETHVTSAGLAALRTELERLQQVERPAVIERVKHARELGDLRENADYEAARNEQSFLEGRIRDLEARIRTAVIIEADMGGTVTLGSTVVLEHDGEESELTIVGSTEADPSRGRISQSSPVGKALLGHRSGETVMVRTPGHEHRYHIIEVR